MAKIADELPLKELVAAKALSPEIDPAWWTEETWTEEAAPTQKRPESPKSATETAPE